MVYFLLAILSSTVNQLLFKTFSKLEINLLAALVANYVACVLIGFGSTFDIISFQKIVGADWFPFSVVQGVLFVGCLFFMGTTTQNKGVAVATLASRLSVALPTITAFFLYSDDLTLLKTVGILLALLALYLSCKSGKNKLPGTSVLSYLPIALFAVFGIHSTLIKFVQEYYLGTDSYHTYVMFAFLSALVVSGGWLLAGVLTKKQFCTLKDLFWGFVLGFSNYGSVYFLIRALAVPRFQSSVLFPTGSVAVIALSSMGSWLIFRELIKKQTARALLLGVGAIIFLNM